MKLQKCLIQSNIYLEEERYASKLTNMSLNNKVIKKYGKIDLKDYVTSFIKDKNYENCSLKSIKKEILILS